MELLRIYQGGRPSSEEQWQYQSFQQVPPKQHMFMFKWENLLAVKGILTGAKEDVRRRHHRVTKSVQKSGRGWMDESAKYPTLTSETAVSHQHSTLFDPLTLTKVLSQKWLANDSHRWVRHIKKCLYVSFWTAWASDAFWRLIRRSRLQRRI